MLMLYPGERPVYDNGAPSPLSAEVRLTYGENYATASTRITAGGALFRGAARVRRALLTDKLVTDRLLQKIIKLSFYKAAMSAGALDPAWKKPVWGALTGIRPGKIATGCLERGVSPKKTQAILENDYFVSPERAALTLDTARAGLKVKNALDSRDVALYVGIPFCPTRCAYCSFVSHSVEKSMKLVEPFLDALLREISALADVVRALGLGIVSVYIGGGTPTTLSAPQLERLMGALGASFDLTKVKDYTVEAGRPDTITREKLDAIRKHGAGRVSINPQSMSDDVLRVIGRRHTVEDVYSAVGLARQAGFQCLNMDLIAGLPGDSADNFKRSLDQVLSLKPENVTVHTLSLKKGTKITLEGMAIPGGEEVSAMLDYAGQRLRLGGYSPYYLYRQKFMSGGFENVGWSQRGFENLYNILIMEELATILALGGGGVTKLVKQNTGRIERIFNLKYPYEYIENIDKVLANKALIPDFYSD